MSLVFNERSSAVIISEKDKLAHLNKWGKSNPESAAIARGIWNDFRTIMIAGTIFDEEIARLEQACYIPGSNGQGAAEYLFHLSKYEPLTIEPIVRRLGSAKSASARFSAMIALSANLPESTYEELVLAAIEDKAANVRWKAGEMAARSQMTAAVPVLQRAIKNEKVQRSADSLHFSLNELLSVSSSNDAPTRDVYHYEYVFLTPAKWK